MSLKAQPTIVTITKEDEAAIQAQFGKDQRTLEQTLGKQKGSPLKFNQSKYWPKSKSPQKFVPRDDDVDDMGTRNEILEKLAMKTAENEKEIDLNETSISAATSKSKKDLSKSLIANLDNEFETLKFKRSAVMAERDKIRKDQIQNALADDEEDEAAFRTTFGQLKDQTSKSLKVTSTIQRNAYGNMQELLEVHRVRMEAIEKEYQQRTDELVSQITDKQELLKLADDNSVFVAEDSKKGKENLKNYSKVDPPPSLNSYMTNPFLMKKKKETPKEKKLQQIKNIKKKRDDLKTHKEKFLEYIEDKKEKIERKKNQEDVSPGIAPPQQQVIVQRHTAVERPSHISERWTENSPSRKNTQPRLGEGSNLVTPARSVNQIVSPGGSVKQLPSRQASASAKKNKRSSVSRPAGPCTSAELRNLLEIFNSLKKGEKPTVNKQVILNFIMKSPQLFEIYALDLMALRMNLEDFPSEFKHSMAFEEFVAFLKDPRVDNLNIIQQILNEIEDLGEEDEDVLAETAAARKKRNFVTAVKDERVKTEIQKLRNKFENFCLLPDEKLDLFKNVFNKLSGSVDPDQTVDRLEYARKLREDENIRLILREAAVYISEYDEYVSLERVLKQIENELKRAPARIKKNKEKVSYTQFLKFFTNYELNKVKGADDDLLEQNIDDGEHVDIKPDRLQFFKDIFDSLPKNKAEQGDKTAFLDYLRSTDYFTAVSDEVARQKAILFDLPTENIGETLARVEKEADANLGWEDFKQFFTRRGRPLKVILSLTDIDGSKRGSKILDENYLHSRDLTQQQRLVEAYEEDDEEDDIHPTVSIKSKYMRYDRADRDHALNKKAFKAALEAAEQDIQEEEDWAQIKAEEKERKEAEELRKKVYGSKFGALYKESADYKITEPTPFKFDARDKNKPKTIRERKVEEMLLEKEQKELEVINVHFRANSVPRHVGMNLFEQIMEAQEDRRRQVKMDSIAITKAREAPFSFYFRDQKQANSDYPLNDEFSVRFKANPVPEHVKDRNLWTNTEKQRDIERQERINARVEANKDLASLPPRMAAYEKERLAKEEEDKQMKKSKPAIKPFKANEIPDFERLQKEFQNSLDQKRQSKKLTDPKGFNFQETRKGVKRKYLDIENQTRKAAKDPNRKDPFESVAKLKSIKPKLQPATTKKTLALMDKRKEEREERERREMQKKIDEYVRYEKYHKMRPRVQASPAIVDNARAKEERDRLIKEEIRMTMVDNQRRFEDEMRQIHERIELRPLLVEQEGYKNQRLTHQAGREMGERYEGEEIEEQEGEEDIEEGQEGQHEGLEGEPQMIDPRYLTPQELAYLQQEGYLPRDGNYEVAEEEEEEEEDDDDEGEEGGHRQQHQHHQHQHHHHHQGQGQEEEEEEYEEEEGEEGEHEGEEEEDEEGMEEMDQIEGDDDGEEYEEGEYEEGYEEEYEDQGMGGHQKNLNHSF